MLSTENYIAASSTFRVSQGEKASLNVTSGKKNTFPDTVFSRRFPDNWIYSESDSADKSLPFTFDNVSQADAGIYILGNAIGSHNFNKSVETAEGKGAYFHLIVQGKIGILCVD